MKMLQLFVFAAFLATVAEANTALQTFCASRANAVYYGTSCYVYRQGAARYSIQKNKCQDILGYYGHLAFIKNVGILSVINATVFAAGGIYEMVYVGFEQYNTTGARNASWGFGNIDGSVTPSTYAPWGSPYPSAASANTRVAFVSYWKGYQDLNGENGTVDFVCEYEEGNYHPVTPLEQLCNGTNFTHIFVNNKCYTLHPELKTYLAAKSSCTDLPGMSGYLAQPHSSSDLNILDNLLLIPTGSFLGTIHIGLQYTSSGWYHSNGINPNSAATYLPWAPSFPSFNSLNGLNNVYYQNRSYYDGPSVTPRSFICEYSTFDPVYTRYANVQPDTQLFMSIDTYTNVSFAKCLRLCRIDDDCTSSAYSTAMSACQLLGVAGSTAAANFTTTPDYEIFTVVP